MSVLDKFIKTAEELSTAEGRKRLLEAEVERLEAKVAHMADQAEQHARGILAKAEQEARELLRSADARLTEVSTLQKDVEAREQSTTYLTEKDEELKRQERALADRVKEAEVMRADASATKEYWQERNKELDAREAAISARETELQLAPPEPKKARKKKSAEA